MSSPAPAPASPKANTAAAAVAKEPNQAPTPPPEKPVAATSASNSTANATEASVNSPGPATALSPAPASDAAGLAPLAKPVGDEVAVTADAPATPAPAADAAENASASDAAAADEEDIGPVPTDPEGIINMEIFGQIQDMDDDDEDDAGGHEFSKGIVWGYFEQAENTFKQMEEAIAEPSLWKLSSLGHFLKGSSAALGIIKVQNSCEKMQHYGNLRDEEVGAALSEDEALKRIRKLLVDCKRDYAVASAYLRQLYASYDE